MSHVAISDSKTGVVCVWRLAIGILTLTLTILTTHSPVVVASVPRGNIRILGEDAATVPAMETRGRDAGDILNTVLGASSRPEEAGRLFDLFNCAVDEERFDDARLALQELEELVGADDPDVVAAKTTLELEELLS